MSWLKVCDSFDRNPKVLALGSDEKRWTWMRVLLYAANARGPVLPENINEVVPKANKAFIKLCIEVGLIDVEDGVMRVHDWSKYQPRDATNADRQATFRASRNAKVTDETVTPTVTVTEGVSNGPSRARVPVQSSPIESSNEDSLAPPAAAQKRPGRRKKEKKEHPPGHNEVFALVGKVLRQQPANDHEYGFWHNYIAQIHKSLIAGGFQPEQWEEEIRRVCRVLFVRWGNDASGINPQSLAKWWASCAPESGFTAEESDYPAWVNDLPSELACVVREFPVSKVWRDMPEWWVEDVESGVLDSETLRFRLGRRP